MADHPSSSSSSSSSRPRRISGLPTLDQEQDYSNPNSSGMDTPGSDSGGELVATSTVTTQFQRREKGSSSAAGGGDSEGELGQALDRALAEGEAGGSASAGKRRETKTTTVTHLGARGMEHQIDQDGGVHLKPQQSPSSKRKGKKIRALVSFQPRNSRFDSFNRDTGKDP